MFKGLIGNIKNFFKNFSKTPTIPDVEVWASGLKAKSMYPGIDLRTARNAGVRYSKSNDFQGRGARYSYCIDPDLKKYAEMRQQGVRKDGADGQ